MQDRFSDLMGPAGTSINSFALDELVSPSMGTPVNRKEAKEKGKKEKKKSKKEKKKDQENDEFMEEFFLNIKEMKDGILFIEKTIGILQSTDKTMENLSQLLGETNCTVAQVRDQLLLVGKQNTKLAEYPDIACSSEFLIRVNTYNALKTKFFDCARSYEEAQLHLKNKEKTQLERRIKIVHPQATEQDVDNLIENGGEAVFADTILQKDSQWKQAKNALEQVENQRAQVLQLEQSIMELHQLFIDLAILVEEQGEMLNVIEANVQKTVAYVETANADLRIAYKHSKSARKKMAFIIGGITAGIAAGALGIATKIVGM